MNDRIHGAFIALVYFEAQPFTHMNESTGTTGIAESSSIHPLQVLQVSAQ
jgi:hypothetical protein